MRIALYLRVSTSNQRQAQTIEQQLDQLQHALQERQWTVAQAHIFRDDGFSGASLNRPGLDRLRDCVRNRELDAVLITAPDRLARHYIHQMVSALRTRARRLPGRVSRTPDEPGPA